MIFERIKSEGIAHNSYFITSGGSAAVIDPRRDIQVYLNLAAEHEVNIKYVLETHRNEDYVIGSAELAARQSFQANCLTFKIFRSSPINILLPGLLAAQSWLSPGGLTGTCNNEYHRQRLKRPGCRL